MDKAGKNEFQVVSGLANQSHGHGKFRCLVNCGEECGVIGKGRKECYVVERCGWRFTIFFGGEDIFFLEIDVLQP